MPDDPYIDYIIRNLPTPVAQPVWRGLRTGHDPAGQVAEIERATEEILRFLALVLLADAHSRRTPHRMVSATRKEAWKALKGTGQGKLLYIVKGLSESLSRHQPFMPQIGPLVKVPEDADDSVWVEHVKRCMTVRRDKAKVHYGHPTAGRQLLEALLPPFQEVVRGIAFLTAYRFGVFAGGRQHDEPGLYDIHWYPFRGRLDRPAAHPLTLPALPAFQDRKPLLVREDGLQLCLMPLFRLRDGPCGADSLRRLHVFHPDAPSPYRDAEYRHPAGIGQSETHDLEPYIRDPTRWWERRNERSTLRQSGMQQVYSAVNLPAQYEVMGPSNTEAPGFHVLKVRHRQLGRISTIQVPRWDTLASVDFIQELGRRVRRHQSVAHPRCVEVLELGFCRNSAPFLELSELPGRNLRALVADYGTLEAAGAVQICMEVLDLIDDLHAHGVYLGAQAPADIALSSSGVHLLSLLTGAANSFGAAGSPDQSAGNGHPDLSFCARLLCHLLGVKGHSTTSSPDALLPSTHPLVEQVGDHPPCHVDGFRDWLARLVSEPVTIWLRRPESQKFARVQEATDFQSALARAQQLQADGFSTCLSEHGDSPPSADHPAWRTDLAADESSSGVLPSDVVHWDQNRRARGWRWVRPPASKPDLTTALVASFDAAGDHAIAGIAGAGFTSIRSCAFRPGTTSLNLPDHALQVSTSASTTAIDPLFDELLCPETPLLVVVDPPQNHWRSLLGAARRKRIPVAILQAGSAPTPVADCATVFAPVGDIADALRWTLRFAGQATNRGPSHAEKRSLDILAFFREDRDAQMVVLNPNDSHNDQTDGSTEHQVLDHALQRWRAEFPTTTQLPGAVPHNVHFGTTLPLGLATLFDFETEYLDGRVWFPRAHRGSPAVPSADQTVAVLALS